MEVTVKIIAVVMLAVASVLTFGDVAAADGGFCRSFGSQAQICERD
jgi:hypothetical protein